MAELNEAAATGEGINAEERMFGWGTSKYEHIAKMIAKLEPYHALWCTVFEFYEQSGKWLNKPFKEVGAEAVEEAVTEMFRKVYKLTKTFSGVASDQPEQQAPMKVAAEVRLSLSQCGYFGIANVVKLKSGRLRQPGMIGALHMQCKEKIAAFQQYLPLMHAVCNQGMRDRHWDLVAEETGIEVSGESTASLKYLLENEILEFLPRMVEVSDQASREWSIEKALSKMLTDWADLELELADWKETGARDACRAVLTTFAATSNTCTRTCHLAKPIPAQRYRSSAQPCVER